MNSSWTPGRRAVAGVAAATLLASVAACSSSSGSGSGSGSGDLTWALPAPPNNLDITKAINATSYTVQSAGLETLVHSENGKIIPWLATSWSHPDPLTYVFHLRGHVTFWDGDPLTAADVAFSIQRSAKSTSLISYDFTALKSATATGTDQVTVKLKHPDPLFLQVAIGTDAFIVQKSYVQSAGSQIGTPSKLTMGTGPFQFKGFSKTSGVTLARYGKYWGKKPPFNSVKFTAISDPETMRIALTQGQVDGTFDGPPADAKRYQSNETKVMLAPGLGYTYVSLDVRHPPFNDVHVRKAIALAVNKSTIAQAVAGKAAQPADALMTRREYEATFGKDGQAFTSQMPPVTTNLAAAKAEMRRSRHPNGFTSTVQFNSAAQLAFQVIQQELAPLGIVLKGQQIDDNQFYDEIGKIKNPQGFRIIESGAASTDPWEALRSVLGDANTSGYYSKVITNNLNVLATTSGPAKRKNAVLAISKDIADQVPFIPLYTTKQMLVLNTGWAYDNFTPRGSGWILKVHQAK